MTRFLTTWIGLGLTATMVTYGVDLGVFRHVDLTFTQFAILLVTPALQAAVLTWPSDLPGRAAAAWAVVWRHSLGAPLVLLDGLLFAIGLATWAAPPFGLGAEPTVQSTWIGVKALATAALALFAVSGMSMRSRVVLIASSTLVASAALGNGVERAFQLVDAQVATVAEVWVRLTFYGALAITTLVAWQRTARTLCATGQFWIGVAMSAGVVASILVVLAMFNSPGVVAPWRGPAMVCASIGVTALLLAVLTQMVPPRERA